MNTSSIVLQMQANAAYKRGDLVEAIQLTKTAQKASSSDQAKRELQERIDVWERELFKQEGLED